MDEVVVITCLLNEEDEKKESKQTNILVAKHLKKKKIYVDFHLLNLSGFIRENDFF